MNAQKNFFQLLGDWLAARQAHRAAITQTHSPRRLTGWLPTRGNVIFTLAMIALLVLAQSAGALPLARTQPAPAAASTSTIAYQGRLADSADAPLTGTYNMIFRLYDAATGGTPLWSEPWTGSNGVRVSDGLFNVMLGSLSALPISQFTNFQSLFLGVTVDTDDEMAPRVQLGSVPFAVQALTVPDGSITKAKLAADVSLTPLDGSITTAKIVDGAVTSQKQSAVTYYLNDNSFVPSHSGESKTLSAFTLQQVPAGDVAFYCSFIASTDATNGIGGYVLLQTSPGGDLAWMPTHIFGNIWDNYVVHGRLSSFAGGDLVVRLVYGGEGGNIKVYFGASNSDARFGRKCTVIAGI